MNESKTVQLDITSLAPKAQPPYQPQYGPQPQYGQQPQPQTQSVQQGEQYDETVRLERPANNAE